MTDPQRVSLTIYVRSGCHLCEDLLFQLEDLRQMHPFDYMAVDVDSDPVLAERYGTLIPLVMLGERELCHYFLDQAGLLAALEDINN